MCAAADCLCVSSNPPRRAARSRRADGAGSSFDLPWTKNWWGVTDGFTPTEKPPTEFSVYKMAPYGKKEGCAAWACDQFKGM